MALTDEKKEQKIQCDNCTDENSAAIRCEECAVFLCSYCSEFHKKSRSTKHHILTTLQELKSAASPTSVAEKIRCKKHKEELIKLYCKTCQSTICRDCTIVEHRTHDYAFIEDVALVQKEMLKQNMNEVKKRQATLKRGIASLKLFDQSLVQENASVVAQVTSHFEELQRIFVSKKNELLSKARSLTSLKRKQIQAQIEALEVAMASCESSIGFTEKALKNGNDAQVLSMQKYILQSLQGLKKVKDVTQPCVTRELTFTIPWPVEDTKQNFLQNFSVQESVADPNQCQAEFIDQSKYLKRDNETSVKIICFDKHKNRVKHGGQVVQASISGTEHDDATIQDHTDGTYTVTFIPRGGGTLEFKATIDGHPAPRCSLTKDVAWIFSNDHGNGELSDGGAKLSCGEYAQCWRIGERSFESGIHSWKVLVKTAVQSNTRRPRRNFYGSNSYCLVGVTSTGNQRGTYTQEVSCQLGTETTVSLMLDVDKRSLIYNFDGKQDLFGGKQDLSGNNTYALTINGMQFWPYVVLYGNEIEAVLKHD